MILDLVQAKKLEEFLETLKSEKVFDTQIVEIFFIVPSDILASFKIRQIENPKSLAKHYGWPSTERKVRNRISILGSTFTLKFSF